jgi:hypothetical protein
VGDLHVFPAETPGDFFHQFKVVDAVTGTTAKHNQNVAFPGFVFRFHGFGRLTLGEKSVYLVHVPLSCKTLFT